MDKETLSNYGWIVICVLVLAVMLALATPFGSFIAGAIKSTTAGLFDVNQAALGSAGIDVNDMVFENCDHLETELRNVTDTYTGDTCCKACGAVMSAGQTVRAKVPEGGTYFVGVADTKSLSPYSTEFNTYTAKYGPGEEMPETVNVGDVYIYGDYEYRYNQRIQNEGGNQWQVVDSLNGWGVRVRDTSRNSYGELLKSINGKPITSLRSTYYYCTRLTIIPAIPDTVTDMYSTYHRCTGLRDASYVVIPNGVTQLYRTFGKCTSLTNDGMPTIPSSVEELGSTFEDCSSLTNLSSYNIPNTVKKLQTTFAGCTSLTDDGLPTIPSSIVDMHSTFRGCTSLVDLRDYVIPSNVTTIQATFAGCTSLVYPPDLSQANIITNMWGTFSSCSALQYAPIIPQSVTEINECFSNCSSLEYFPEGFSFGPNMYNITSVFLKCTSIKEMPSTFAIPKSVRLCQSVFNGCTSLTGTIVINSDMNTGGVSYFFKDTVQPIRITGTGRYLSDFAKTATNNNVTVQ